MDDCAVAGTEQRQARWASRQKSPCTALTSCHPSSPASAPSLLVARVFCNTLYRIFLEHTFQRTEATGLAPPRPLPPQSHQQQQHPACQDKLPVYRIVKDSASKSECSKIRRPVSQETAINY